MIKEEDFIGWKAKNMTFFQQEPKKALMMPRRSLNVKSVELQFILANVEKKVWTGNVEKMLYICKFWSVKEFLTNWRALLILG